MRDFAQALRSARLKNHMSQEVLANRMHTKQSHLSMWEHGIRQPSLTQMMQLSVIFSQDEVLLELLIRFMEREVERELLSIEGVVLSDLILLRKRILVKISQSIQSESF